MMVRSIEPSDRSRPLVLTDPAKLRKSNGALNFR